VRNILVASLALTGVSLVLLFGIVPNASTWFDTVTNRASFELRDEWHDFQEAPLWTVGIFLLFYSALIYGLVSSLSLFDTQHYDYFIEDLGCMGSIFCGALMVGLPFGLMFGN
jgi:hypothetical protein